MQEEILRFIEKKRKELPCWVAQFELMEALIKKDDCPGRVVCLSKNFERLRKGKEIDFLVIRASDIKLKIILKKIDREDLLGQRKHFRNIGFMYRVK